MALRAGRRTLEEVEGVRVVSDWELDRPGHWRLEVELAPGPLGSVWEVPAVTRWFVRAGEDYPDGLIDILPSREGGLPASSRTSYTARCRRTPVPRRQDLRGDRHGGQPAHPR